MPSSPPSVSPNERALRTLLLALLTFGMAGMGGELVAMGHYEEGRMLIPLALLGAGLVTVTWHWFERGAASLKVLRAVLVAMFVAGLVGIVLHYQGNMEFQKDVNPDLAGWALVAKVLHAKVPPALAPGTMSQLALLGLIYTFRHPALRRR
jgi:hypothetical protein